jgi:hypothetical protein
MLDDDFVLLDLAGRKYDDAKNESTGRSISEISSVP